MGFSREFSGSIANAGEHAVNDSKLRWQCRRGMRELDLLLTDYLENDLLAFERGAKAGVS